NQQTQQAIQAMLADTHTRLDRLAGEAAQYARVAHQSARRMALIAVAVGGAAGVLGGLLAGLALGQLLVSCEFTLCLLSSLPSPGGASPPFLWRSFPPQPGWAPLRGAGTCTGATG